MQLPERVQMNRAFSISSNGARARGGQLLMVLREGRLVDYPGQGWVCAERGGALCVMVMELHATCRSGDGGAGLATGF